MSATTPPILYRLGAACLLPVYAIHTLLRAKKDGGTRYLQQRFGFAKKDATKRIWLHAASVGEVQTVLPLIRAALLQNHELNFLVTTTTPTGSVRVTNQLIQEFPDRVIHRYTPVDLRFATRRFFVNYAIDAAWIVETEIWPWLFSEAQKFDIPITIINGRLTQKTVTAAQGWLRRSYQTALQNVRVLARSRSDAHAFVTLGVSSDRVETLGDLKFSDNRPAQTPRLIPYRYCIAASTHDDEELQLARAWLTKSVGALLIFAPRHHERGTLLHHQLTDLLTELGRDPNSTLPPLRSLGGAPTTESLLYIADTHGELPSWYAHCHAAFVGGSLIERGGHNMLEPMHAGAPIIVGPHTENFEAPMVYLRDYSAVNEVATAADAVALMDKLVNSEPFLVEQRNAVNDAAGSVDAAVDNYLDRLLRG